MKRAFSFFLIWLCLASPAEASTRGLGFGRGKWTSSLGLFLWKDTFKLRNLQWQGDLDLYPGTRLHGVVRSNRKFDSIEGFDPYLDEGYLEGFGFFQFGGTLGLNLKLGRTRILRFPYPDAISVFDQVPGIGDLKGKPFPGYEGPLFTLDYDHDTGLGWHYSSLWGKPLEHFFRVRQGWGPFRLEGRAGELAVRPEPLGRTAGGFNLYFSTKLLGFEGGVLYERLTGQPIMTGVVVYFPTNWLTQFMGTVRIDYTRSPQGNIYQLPLLSGSWGFHKQPPPNGVLVGEVVAERLRTYWQNGQNRNFYEHRLSSWGRTAEPGLVAVMEEEPWVLQAEALVSPHNAFRNWDDLVAWERSRMGPAQLSQKVRYRFYALPEQP